MSALDDLIPTGGKGKKAKQGKAKDKPTKKQSKEPRRRVTTQDDYDDYEPPKKEGNKRIVARDTERPDIPDDLLRITDDEASDDDGTTSYAPPPGSLPPNELSDVEEKAHYLPIASFKLSVM